MQEQDDQRVARIRARSARPLTVRAPPHDDAETSLIGQRESPANESSSNYYSEIMGLTNKETESNMAAGDNQSRKEDVRVESRSSETPNYSKPNFRQHLPAVEMQQDHEIYQFIRNVDSGRGDIVDEIRRDRFDDVTPDVPPRRFSPDDLDVVRGYSTEAAVSVKDLLARSQQRVSRLREEEELSTLGKRRDGSPYEYRQDVSRVVDSEPLDSSPVEKESANTNDMGQHGVIADDSGSSDEEDIWCAGDRVPSSLSKASASSSDSKDFWNKPVSSYLNQDTF